MSLVRYRTTRDGELIHREEQESHALMDHPAYEVTSPRRRQLASEIAIQILLTCEPCLDGFQHPLSILDVGCGCGSTAIELARQGHLITAIDVCESSLASANRLKVETQLTNVDFRQESIETLDDQSCYDLVVLDNTLEHVAHQECALQRISAALRVGGVAYIVVPNRLWPIEVHYHLPFLSYLPLKWANRYLMWTGRGSDYTDASYAPTYSRMCRLLQCCPNMSYRFMTPANISLTAFGHLPHYRIGVALLTRFPVLWMIAKVFLIVARKER